MPIERTTGGRLLLEDAVPEEARAHVGVPLDKKGIKALFTKLAEMGPDAYRETALKLQHAAGRAGMESGGYSFSLEHMAPTPAIEAARTRIRQNVARVLADRRLSDADRDRKIIEAVEGGRSAFEAATKAALDPANPLARQVLGEVKGNVANFATLIAGDLLYADPNRKTVPFPILHGYAEGLDPHEYFAGTFGARSGLTDLKLGTADAGWAAKRLLNAAHRASVTAHDGPDPEAGAAPRGYPVDLDDPDNEGALLAHPAGKYPRNTVLTRGVLEDLSRKGINRLLVRSPTVGGPENGGIYARDAGVGTNETLPGVGEQVGINAAQAVSEPMTQMSISSKHQGGVAGATKSQEGFPVLDQLISVPQTYRDGVVYARGDGKVKSVTKAAQGGWFIDVDGEQHYADPDRVVKVKPGHAVEAGDELTDGLPNPAEVTHHRGIGEGRRAFIESFLGAAKAAGFQPHRRNLEVLAKGLVNHVRLHEEIDHHAPGDVIPYQTVEASYKPRAGAEATNLKSSVGRYLETPVLHHSIGTRITNRVASELKDWGVDKITTHPEPPPFEPVMVRSHDISSVDPDWGVRFLGTNLHKSILRAAHTGNVSSETGSSFVPTLMAGGTRLPVASRPIKSA